MFKDARDYQIIFLTLFLCLGIGLRDWSLRPEMVGAAVGTAIVVQLLLSWLITAAGFILGQWTGFRTQSTQQRLSWSAFRSTLNWRSPLITALGLSLLLRTDHVWTMALAAGCAIASKFIFKAQDKHFFNPANFGIIAALVLTQDAWVSPGQWGEDLWYGFIFLGAGGLVLKRVGRWDTTGMFLASYALMEALRNLYLGWTWDVWAHRMMSGSLLLFALFMVTDPRSIPNARSARLVWAMAIALLTFVLRNQFYLTTAVFWALFALAPLTVLLDRLWRAPRFEWRAELARKWVGKWPVGTRVCSLLLVFFFAFTSPALAFCGFYVTRADTSLYNQTSQVAIAQEGDRTVLTMANDFRGDVEDFAMVVPVPVVLSEEQVKVADPIILDRLDAFSAPRLVEYFDDNPCEPVREEPEFLQRAISAPASAAAIGEADELGVTIESSFSVGEYDILILSATESNGLETWMLQNDYRLPRGASRLLQPYIRQGLKFFVAKVNLAEFDSSSMQKLRPLQMSYQSPRFMLPIRLGMMNAESEQDLVVYLLSPSGRTELTNYRTVNIPSDVDVPLFVQDEFGEFYTAMFERSYSQEGRNVAFLEYAWDMGKCDPCAAGQLSPEELRQAGVTWIDQQSRID
ncbi:DUF2330 domain-containing protein [cf. Phormidesmis sp. LEGE 11477]|uniref:DUF2330 domain-containing protein n=1 Tax=cf. Phormidesmis sp. LEGE 11477 TaxID=1828680 RepID=UPI00351D90D4